MLLFPPALFIKANKQFLKKQHIEINIPMSVLSRISIIFINNAGDGNDFARNFGLEILKKKNTKNPKRDKTI